MKGSPNTTPEKLLIAAPRGSCAGVDRAVHTVECALEAFGSPVYVRKQIVHNKHVLQRLSEQGAVFVDDVDDVPEGEVVIFSAHGVAPAVRDNAANRRLTQIDATCPLVTKVHVEAKRFARAGYTIVVVGHSNHEEVEGTMGEAPAATALVECEEDVDRLELPDPSRVAYLTQTTLSVEETRRIVARLRKRFPRIVGPKSEDICYATTNRQLAVRELAWATDLVLVIGSTNSSNSNRLVETAEAAGTEAHLIDDETDIDERWLRGRSIVGITSGASVPDVLVQRVVDWFARRGTHAVEELEVSREEVRFMLPREVRGGDRRVRPPQPPERAMAGEVVPG